MIRPPLGAVRGAPVTPLAPPRAPPVLTTGLPWSPSYADSDPRLGARGAVDARGAISGRIGRWHGCGPRGPQWGRTATAFAGQAGGAAVSLSPWMPRSPFAAAAMVAGHIAWAALRPVVRQVRGDYTAGPMPTAEHANGRRSAWHRRPVAAWCREVVANVMAGVALGTCVSLAAGKTPVVRGAAIGGWAIGGVLLAAIVVACAWPAPAHEAERPRLVGALVAFVGHALAAMHADWRLHNEARTDETPVAQQDAADTSDAAIARVQHRLDALAAWQDVAAAERALRAQWWAALTCRDTRGRIALLAVGCGIGAAAAGGTIPVGVAFGLSGMAISALLHSIDALRDAWGLHDQDVAPHVLQQRARRAARGGVLLALTMSVVLGRVTP